MADYDLHQVLQSPPGRWHAAYWNVTTATHEFQLTPLIAIVVAPAPATGYTVVGLVFDWTTCHFVVADTLPEFCGIAPAGITPQSFTCPRGH